MSSLMTLLDRLVECRMNTLRKFKGHLSPEDPRRVEIDELLEEAEHYLELVKDGSSSRQDTDSEL